jgi:hypothetical protein
MPIRSKSLGDRLGLVKHRGELVVGIAPVGGQGPAARDCRGVLCPAADGGGRKARRAGVRAAPLLELSLLQVDGRGLSSIAAFALEADPLTSRKLPIPERSTADI